MTKFTVSGFLEDLMASGQNEWYLHRLVDAFNPAEVAGVMCRNMLSVGWDGLSGVNR